MSLLLSLSTAAKAAALNVGVTERPEIGVEQSITTEVTSKVASDDGFGIVAAPAGA
jgi:hypothetical protein